MLSRFITVTILAAAIVPATAGVKDVPPEIIACHREATQRYIADIRQVSAPRKHSGDVPVVVTHFENETPRFEAYVAECLARGKFAKTSGR